MVFTYWNTSVVYVTLSTGHFTKQAHEQLKLSPGETTGVLIAILWVFLRFSSLIFLWLLFRNDKRQNLSKYRHGGDLEALLGGRRAEEPTPLYGEA